MLGSIDEGSIILLRIVGHTAICTMDQIPLFLFYVFLYKSPYSKLLTLLPFVPFIVNNIMSESA